MKRPSYHHGDLANALTLAATQLARDGGPEAVVLREAARQVGVSATAAYRHFSGHGELMHAVKEHAMELLVANLHEELGRTPSLPDPAAEAARHLRALGYGYLAFALAEPGLFRTAFCPPVRGEPTNAGLLPVGLIDAEPHLGEVTPYLMLVEAVDAFVSAGVLPPERRPGAEVFAWSAVHGLASLLLDGPLRNCTPAEREGAIERTLDGVAAGLASA
jgi:AcrR family transcriptional regulator